MGSYSMFRPHNSAGNGASVWAPDEPTAAQVFVTAGRARSLNPEQMKSAIPVTCVTWVLLEVAPQDHDE